MSEETLRRINTLLDALERHALDLIAAANPQNIEPKDAAIAAGKHAMVIARLLELRRQVEGESSSGGHEDELLRALLGDMPTLR